jgi:hypothetical protein
MTNYMKELKGLRMRQRSVERLGCIQGCLAYLGADVSFPWLYGGTGHAFIISLDPGVDVSSPDSWDHGPQFALGRNLGYVVEGVCATQEEAGETFPQKQREAWDFVRGNIDRGVPCFGFELKKYYGGYWVIYGYEEDAEAGTGGYFYAGWKEGGPLPWQELGALFVPVLEVRSVQLCDPAPAEETVKEGLAFALQHAETPPDLIEPQARSGPTAWAYWAEALETGEAKRDHHTYNLGLWLECREMAVAFLPEAKACLAGRCAALFDEAARHYDRVCEKLKALLALHPEREAPDWGPDSTFASPEAAALVRETASADARGLACLRQIVDAL